MVFVKIIPLNQLELIDRLMILMDKRNTPLAIFLDFSKAFDTLDHEILLYKLKQYGIKDKVLFYFEITSLTDVNILNQVVLCQICLNFKLV